MNTENDMTGIIAAMSCEAEMLLDIMQNKEEHRVGGAAFYTGKIANEQVVLSTCGVGKVFAASCALAMIIKFSPERIINTGVAGALSQSLNKLDTVIGTSAVQHDMDTTALGDLPGEISGIKKVFFECDESISEKLLDSVNAIGGKAKRGIVATGDRFVSSAEDKAYIRKTFGADCADMEGGAIAHVCYVNNVPFAALRTMSDGADGDASGDFMEFCTKAAKISSNALIEYLKTL